MIIKDYKCKCGYDDFFFADKGGQKGIYCSYCGKWLKWADKDEQNLRMKQVLVLDKIRAEISDFEEEVFNRPNTDYSDYAAVRHCLEIIDRYRNEVSE